jgi:hypothetical protein
LRELVDQFARFRPEVFERIFCHYLRRPCAA